MRRAHRTLTVIAPRLRVVVLRTSQGALALAALGYALLALLYCMPMTPAKLRFQAVLEEDFSPLFYQNWSLFAPEPINQDDTLLVHCSVDASLATTGGVPDDAWEDIISPMWELARTHRLSPWERLSRPLAYPVRAYQGNSTELVPWATACVTGEQSACAVFENASRLLRVHATRRLVAIGTAYCRAAHPQRALSRLALRVRQTRPPPWSKRFDGPFMAKDTDVGVFDPSPDVLPIAYFVVAKD